MKDLTQEERQALLDYCKNEVHEMEKDLNSAKAEGWTSMTKVLEMDLRIYQAALISLNQP